MTLDHGACSSSIIDCEPVVHPNTCNYQNTYSVCTEHCQWTVLFSNIYVTALPLVALLTFLITFNCTSQWQTWELIHVVLLSEHVPAIIFSRHQCDYIHVLKKAENWLWLQVGYKHTFLGLTCTCTCMYIHIYRITSYFCDPKNNAIHKFLENFNCYAILTLQLT